MIPGLSPQDIGLPAKFSHWRKGQITALDRGLSSDKRFLLHSMPVGEGKSLYYIGHALLAAKRACVLTSSKGLQDQLLRDFGGIGLVDMRGRNNYPCSHKEARTCDEGQYFRCVPDDCMYERSRTKALEAFLVTTNYSYYMLSYLYGRGLGEFDLLICDEAHDAPDEVCSAMAIEVTYGEATKIGIRLPREDSGMEAWWEWAELAGGRCVSRLEELKLEAEEDRNDRGRIHPQTARDQHFWSRIARKCMAIIASRPTLVPPEVNLKDTEWIVERTHEGYKLEPIWASQYSHQVLFRNVPKIILTSATMVRKTVALLGISPEESAFYEYPSSFPTKRSPVYLWGPCKIDHRTGPEYLDVWLSRINNIIRKRQDRKGIIHTVSYDRARFIHSKSEFRSQMIVPANGKETQDALYRFQDAKPPCVLVSPAITTGYDFPFSDCEFNIIAKVPFLDTRQKLIAARQASDPEYAPYITAQTIVQSHGRSMRAADDQSESFILDDNMRWFIKKSRHLFPLWFHNLVSYPQGMPEPPAPLNRRVVNRPPRELPAPPSQLLQELYLSNVIEFSDLKRKI